MEERGWVYIVRELESVGIRRPSGEISVIATVRRNLKPSCCERVIGGGVRQGLFEVAVAVGGAACEGRLILCDDCGGSSSGVFGIGSPSASSASAP